jgi:hypothetical protein
MQYTASQMNLKIILCYSKLTSKLIVVIPYIVSYLCRLRLSRGAVHNNSPYSNYKFKQRRSITQDNS